MDLHALQNRIASMQDTSRVIMPDVPETFFLSRYPLSMELYWEFIAKENVSIGLQLARGDPYDIDTSQDFPFCCMTLHQCLYQMKSHQLQLGFERRVALLLLTYDTSLSAHTNGYFKSFGHSNFNLSIFRSNRKDPQSNRHFCEAATKIFCLFRDFQAISSHFGVFHGNTTWKMSV